MARVITNKGSILITTLWIVSILAVMAVGIGFRVSVETRLSKYYAESQKALYLAKAGVIKSQYLLSSSKKDYDYVYECGIDYSEDNNPEQIFGYDMNIMESGSFSVYYELFPDSDEPLKVYGVADEERKININADKLAKGNIGEYRRMLSVLDADITEDIIDAIIDWQDTDETTTGFGGAESFYYESLPKPYSSKNEDYEIIHELLLVKGVSRELYEKLKNYLTVYGDGKVNINTASMKVVNAVIGDGKGTYGGLLNSIAEYKAGADGIFGTADDRIFLKPEDLQSVATDNMEKNRISQVMPYIKVKSDVFMIRAHGVSGKTTKTIECIYTRGQAESGPAVLFYNQD